MNALALTLLSELTALALDVKLNDPQRLEIYRQAIEAITPVALLIDPDHDEDIIRDIEAARAAAHAVAAIIAAERAAHAEPVE